MPVCKQLSLHTERIRNGGWSTRQGRGREGEGSVEVEGEGEGEVEGGGEGEVEGKLSRLYNIISLSYKNQ